jgi:hypothetical protein
MAVKDKKKKTVRQTEKQQKERDIMARKAFAIPASMPSPRVSSGGYSADGKKIFKTK